MYEYHEVLGTDLPIYKEQKKDHYTLNEIFDTEQSSEDFTKQGFVRIYKFSKDFYIPVYAKKGV